MKIKKFEDNNDKRMGEKMLSVAWSFCYVVQKTIQPPSTIVYSVSPPPVKGLLQPAENHLCIPVNRNISLYSSLKKS